MQSFQISYVMHIVVYVFICKLSRERALCLHRISSFSVDFALAGESIQLKMPFSRIQYASLLCFFSAVDCFFFCCSFLTFPNFFCVG